MPYFHLITSAKLSEEKIAAVRKIVGEVIAVIPGKSFEVTTIHIEPEAIISRGDPANPCLFIEVRMFGPSSIGPKQAFAREICAALEQELGIPQQYMSLNIIELDAWGGNGGFHTFR